MDVLSAAVTAARIGKPHSARVRHAAPFGRRFPSFDGAGFHVVVQGRCWLFPPEGEPIPLGPGEVALLPNGSAHGLADGPSTPLRDATVSLAEVQPVDGGSTDTITLCGGYLVDRARPHPLLAELPDVIHVRPRAGRHPSLRAAVDLLDIEVERAGPGSDAMLPALLDVLLLEILRAWFDEAAEEGLGRWAVAMHDPVVAPALRAIHAQPEARWTVAGLAAVAGLSRAAFARRFTTLVGQAPLAYLTCWRMTIAARRLREAAEPLATVARTVGYTSEFAFAQAFKRHYGEPPGRFRRAGSPGA